MASVPYSESVIPHPLPQSPSTAISSHGLTWSSGEAWITSETRKGKEREHSDDASSFDSALQVGPGSYPPTNDDEAESQRVMETLRQWEIVERQRRKAARDSLSESTPTGSTSTGIFSDVAKHAGLLWPRRRSKQVMRNELGTHVALKSQENTDDVPMDDINASLTPTPIPSPVPSPRYSSANVLDNPFAHPSDTSYPFADAYQSITASPVPEQNSSETRISSLLHPPMPKPLDLPPPRTPPPLIATNAGNINSDSENGEVRWWHEWLCGCSEGPDRGGDYQAGKTNPFE